MQQLSFADLLPRPDEPISADDARPLLKPIARDLLQICDDARVAANHAAAAKGQHGVEDSGLSYAMSLHDGFRSLALKRWQQDKRFHFTNLPFCIHFRGLDIVFKKFTRGRLMWNDTEASVRRVRQLEARPQLVVGVSLSPTHDRITRVDLICLRDEQEEWWTEALLPLATVAAMPAQMKSTAGTKPPKFRGKPNRATKGRAKEQ